MAAATHAAAALGLDGTFASDGRPPSGNLDIVKVTGRGEGGNSAAYLAARLKKAGRDDLLQEIGPGKRHESVRAAAIEAGIIRPVPTVRLVDDPVWAQAQAQLQEAVKGKPGGNGSNQHSKSNSAHRAEKQPDPTVGTYGKPKDRKSRLIRTPRRLTAPSLNPATAGIPAHREQPRWPEPVAAMDLPHAT